MSSFFVSSFFLSFIFFFFYLFFFCSFFFGPTSYYSALFFTFFFARIISLFLKDTGGGADPFFFSTFFFNPSIDFEMAFVFSFFVLFSNGKFGFFVIEMFHRSRSIGLATLFVFFYLVMHSILWQSSFTRLALGCTYFCLELPSFST